MIAYGILAKSKETNTMRETIAAVISCPDAQSPIFFSALFQIEIIYADLSAGEINLIQFSTPFSSIEK
ncbi:MAG: hypothetical protein ORN26_02200 [Candidatus Pacebacteria bacterium]|nr:hypothetical protein [Candidatus Paceibacterota bacterium]